MPEIKTITATNRVPVTGVYEGARVTVTGGPLYQCSRCKLAFLDSDQAHEHLETHPPLTDWFLR